MDAAVLHEFGQPPRYTRFADPIPGEGELLVEVKAAALQRIDRARASGTHYAGPRELPVVVGTDGVGIARDEDGDEFRVWFALPRAPFGSMARRAVVSEAMIAPIPDELPDAHAAALVNPGMAALLALSWRARLAEGETVLILGATGVSGRLAVQLARLLGAGRVVAAGRDPKALEALLDLGADSLINLDRPRDALVRDFRGQEGDGYAAVIDYVWGAPTEALLTALIRHEFKAARMETRVVQVGDVNAPVITLPAEVLRSTAISLLGHGGFAPQQVRGRAYTDLMAHAAEGRLRVRIEERPLSEVADAWARGDRDGRRQVLVP